MFLYLGKLLLDLTTSLHINNKALRCSPKPLVPLSDQLKTETHKNQYDTIFVMVLTLLGYEVIDQGFYVRWFFFSLSFFQLGRRMAEFPVEPMMSKMLIASEKYV